MNSVNKAKIKAENKNLKELRIYFDKQILAIPKLQRNFVWNANRMRDFADSIYKGYAIGSFAVWDAPKKRETHFKHFGGVLSPYKEEFNARIHYVIDGQQRLSALASFLKSGGSLIKNDRGQEINSYNICFTVKKSEENLNFVYVKKELDNKNFFSLCDILSDDFDDKFKHLKNKKNKALYKKLADCRQRFANYIFCFVYIRGDINEDDLKETFIRLNTRGLSLSAVDRAYAYASNMNLREFVLRIKANLGSFQTMGDKPIHEVLYALNHGEDARLNSKSIDSFFKQINNNTEKRREFERDWRSVARAVENVERFLKGRGVLSMDYLPSISMIVVLSTFYYHKGDNKLNGFQEKMLNRWFWYASLSNRYSGKGYHYYTGKDCVSMKLLARGKKIKFEDFEKKLDSIDLVNSMYYLRNSSITRAFFCLLTLQKPREFLITGAKYVDLTKPTVRERKENHHIFPQNLMKKAVFPKKYNSIVNICFLPKQTNVGFLDNPPHDYLNGKDVNKKNLLGILKSHLIPRVILRKGGDIKKQFSKFVEVRKEMIVKKFEEEAGFKIFER